MGAMTVPNGALQLHLFPEQDSEKISIQKSPQYTTGVFLGQQKAGELNRSPKDSPPTVKKKLCRLFSGFVDGHVKVGESLSDASTLLSLKTKAGSCRIGQTRELRTKSSSVEIKPILRKCHAQRTRKNVQFNHQVTVLYMTSDGDVFCWDRQELKTEDPSTDLMHADYKRGQIKFASKTATQVTNSPPSSPESTSLAESSPDRPEKRVVSDVNFTFVEDPIRGMMLKFSVPLGPDCRPENIVVKANVSGSRIRLVMNDTIQNPDGSVRVGQVSKRYALPMDVDPHFVTARLDIKGKLTVEAPLLTLARRDVLRKQQAASLKGGLESIPL